MYGIENLAYHSRAFASRKRRASSGNSANNDKEKFNAARAALAGDRADLESLVDELEKAAKGAKKYYRSANQENYK